ncbi:MAG: DedA family protein [Caldilineaceae bacterium]|nr:DedA family protein [Caldilineaceae bacterium]MBP8110029.1 DedA family protein [Caldilineaceae bacterium]MBP8125385.1 DedA family protein [Caldilineaceae bacterium]MBP9074531.1 DedA family protein [Caldilineaceae bacterium]
MELVKTLIDLILHLDKHLVVLIADYGVWTYVILFTIIFCETGLVVTPFLPGDSLLFAAGALAALGSMSVVWLLVLLIIAAIAGDSLNYWVGKRLGLRVFNANIPFLKKEYLTRTEKFYEKYGTKTIFLARFVPIVRTIAPFVAGVGTMEYGRFLSYNVIGGITWVAFFTLGGYFFGNLPVVKENFGIVVIAIILISVLPMVFEFVRARREPSVAN